MGAQQSNFVGRTFAARVSLNHQQYTPYFRVEPTYRGFQSQTAPLYPPIMVNGQPVVPIGIFRDDAFYQSMARSKNEEFEGVAREVLGGEFGPELASVALSLAADPDVLAAIANNDEFQKFRTKHENASLSIESSSVNPLPIAQPIETPPSNEVLEKDLVSTKYLQTNIPVDNDNAQEQMEKILSTSNALRIGTCLSSLDQTKLNNSAKKKNSSSQKEDAMTSEVVQVVCGVCHHPLDVLKPVHPPTDHIGNVVEQPPPVDGPLTTLGNAVRNQSNLLSVLLPLVAAVLVASFLFRSTRCRSFMHRVFSQAVSQLKKILFMSDLSRFSGKLVSPSD